LGILQSIGVIPFLIKNSFVLENGLEPKKPLYAESGEGCTLVSTKCLESMYFFFSIAFFPQRIKTSGFSLSFK